MLEFDSISSLCKFVLLKQSPLSHFKYDESLLHSMYLKTEDVKLSTQSKKNV